MTIKETTSERDEVIKKIKRMVGLAIGNHFLGRIDKALDLTKQAEDLIGKFQGDMPSELEESHFLLLSNKADILTNKGYLTQGFKVANELLTIAGKHDSKWGFSEGHRALGNHYRRSNNLDKALEHLDCAIVLKEELLNDRGEVLFLDWVLTHAIETSVIKNDIERARKYFTRLEELHELKPNDPFVTHTWKLSNIFLLSASIRPRDWGRAEELCEELIQHKFTSIYGQIVSRQILCKLLFFELRVTNDRGIINEIKALFPKMIELAQQYGSMVYLIDFYAIQGKLALLTFDFKTARRSFTQARRIAERHKYFLAAAEISRLQEELDYKLTTWEQLKQKNAPFSERMELARVDEHLNEKFRAQIIRTEKIPEDDVFVYTDSQMCIVCKGNVKGFNVFICPNCKSHYCKTCAQAIIELENECWSCNSPIDASKPVKPYKPEKERVKVDSKESKSPKKK